MKLRILTTLVLTMLVLQSCTKATTKVLWVSGFTVDCSNGAGKTQCIQIFEGEDVNQAIWKSFYAPIEGFEFEPGYLQKIEVSETQLATEEVPADASAIRYELVKVLDKQQDIRNVLNGNWTLTQLNNAPINRMVPVPGMHIDLSKRLFSVNGGCNQYSGPIQAVSFQTIDIGLLRGTKKACVGKNIESEFIQAVSAIYQYQIKGNTVTFLSKEGQALLAFTKK